MCNDFKQIKNQQRKESGVKNKIRTTNWYFDYITP